MNVVSIVLTRNWNCCERCDVGVVEVVAGVVGVVKVVAGVVEVVAGVVEVVAGGVEVVAGVVEVVVGPGFMSLFMFEVLYI